MLALKYVVQQWFVSHVVRLQQLEYALPKLREQLEDKNWYARAEAAVAVGRMNDIRSMSKLRAMIKDPAATAKTIVTASRARKGLGFMAS